MGLRTTVVGSWWKLEEHEHELRRMHDGELSLEEEEALLDAAATAAIAQQRDLGLDVWTGGEYFTDNFIDHMQRVLHGLEVDKPDEPDPFDYDDLAHAVITGELSAPEGLGYARNFRRESMAALECSYFAEWLERDAYRDLPASMELASGIVDEASYGIETVKKVRDRAADWARVVGEERLWISPSCGFGRHPARSRPVLEAKMEHMMEAATSF